MIVIFLLTVGTLAFVGALVASGRERRIEWRAFGLALGLLIAAAAVEFGPAIVWTLQHADDDNPHLH